VCGATVLPVARRVATPAHKALVALAATRAMPHAVATVLKRLVAVTVSTAHAVVVRIVSATVPVATAPCPVVATPVAPKALAHAPSSSAPHAEASHRSGGASAHAVASGQ
jgi:hypothetical protein